MPARGRRLMRRKARTCRPTCLNNGASCAPASSPVLATRPAAATADAVPHRTRDRSPSANPGERVGLDRRQAGLVGQCLALTLPESGPLDEAQTRTLLRLATATARAGDDAGLITLRQKFGDRIGAGPLARHVPAADRGACPHHGRHQAFAAGTEPGGLLPADLKALQAAAQRRADRFAQGLCGFVARLRAKRPLRRSPLIIMFRRLGPRGLWARFRAYSPTGRLLVGRGTR